MGKKYKNYNTRFISSQNSLKKRISQLFSVDFEEKNFCFVLFFFYLDTMKRSLSCDTRPKVMVTQRESNSKWPACLTC